MIRSLSCASLLMLGVAAAANTMVVASDIERSRQCAVEAYADPESRSIAIRSAPGSNGEKLGTIPLSKDEDGRRKGAHLTILSVRDGWAQVADVTSWDNASTAPSGWIEAKHLRFSMQTHIGFADADAESTRVFTSEHWLMPEQILTLQDCDRSWVKLAIATNDRMQVAWFRGACANQETTCDGVLGDPFPEREQSSVPAEH